MLNKHIKQLAGGLLGFLLITSCSKKDYSSPDVKMGLNNKETVATYSAKSARAKTQAYNYDFTIPLDGMVISAFCLSEQITVSGEYRSRVHGIIYPDFTIKEMTLTISGGKAIGESGRNYRFKAVSVEKITTKKVDECSLAFGYHTNYRLLSNGSNYNYYLKVHTTGFFNLCTQTNYGVQTKISEECR